MMKIKFDWIVADTLDWIEGVRTYIEEIEGAIPDIFFKKAEELRLLGQELGWDPDTYFGEKANLERKYNYWLRQTFTYSVITVLHMIVETRLTALSKSLGNRKNIKIKINDIAGSAIDKNKIYLSKVIELNISEDMALEHLRNLAKIRDIIVHRHGAQGQDKKEVHRMIKYYKGGLTLNGRPEDEASELVIPIGQCKDFINVIEEFFKRIFNMAGLSHGVHLVQ